jgi:hypothetical protein
LQFPPLLLLLPLVVVPLQLPVKVVVVPLLPLLLLLPLLVVHLTHGQSQLDWACSR